MILDTIKNIDQYASLHKDFAKVIEFLKALTPNSPAGKTVLDEGNVWVNVFESEGASKDKTPVCEEHRNFIDIQYIVSGSENFGYADISKLTVTTPYNAEKDCEFSDGDFNVFTLNAGDFCILFPQDAHSPAMKKLGDEKLLRAVAKIRI